MKYVLTQKVAASTDATGAVVAEIQVTIEYGAFITTVIDFTIVAFAVFMVIKTINKMKKAEPAPAPAGPQMRKSSDGGRDALVVAIDVTGNLTIPEVSSFKTS